MLLKNLRVILAVLPALIFLRQTAGFAQTSGAELADLAKQEAISHFWLANNYFKQWRLDLSSVELQEAIMYWPDMQAAHKDLCLVQLLCGHPLAAAAEFMMLVGLGEPIPLTAAGKAALNEQAGSLHYRQGLKYGRDCQWQQAVCEFQRALAYKPADVAACRSLAFAQANCGDFDKAEKLYQTSFKMSPTDAFSHADFAYLLALAGQGKQAQEQLCQAVKLAPSAAALHVDLGWMSEAGGDFAAAEKEFRAACTLSPGHGALWAHLGRLLERQSKDRQAIDAYKYALKLDPHQQEALASLNRLLKSVH